MLLKKAAQTIKAACIGALLTWCVLLLQVLLQAIPRHEMETPGRLYSLLNRARSMPAHICRVSASLSGHTTPQTAVPACRRICACQVIPSPRQHQLPVLAATLFVRPLCSLNSSEHADMSL